MKIFEKYEEENLEIIKEIFRSSSYCIEIQRCKLTKQLFLFKINRYDIYCPIGLDNHEAWYVKIEEKDLDNLLRLDFEEIKNNESFYIPSQEYSAEESKWTNINDTRYIEDSIKSNLEEGISLA